MSEITNATKQFEAFLESFEKEDINRATILDMEQRFQQAIRAKSSSTGAKFENKPVELNVHKILEKRATFTVANIPDKALNLASFFVNAAIGILFITVGFFLIVNPATPEMEIVTLFYFNEYDGFTLLDFFALLIIILGIYFFIRAFVKRENR
ncbi:MAG: hypothetical protein IKD55_01730 [Sediminibacterium sp.]|nr:hypothetical protein [Sediminibacterium sp.]MBX9779054.1 hypothetical protein [Chitinophagaceae bacterium]